MIDRDKTQLEFMSEEVEFIIKNLDGVSKDDFLKDDLLQHGICMSVINLGESANNLSEEFTERYTDIPWTQVIAVRNIAVHTYQRLNMEQIWKAVTLDVPQLREFLSKLI